MIEYCSLVVNKFNSNYVRPFIYHGTQEMPELHVLPSKTGDWSVNGHCLVLVVSFVEAHVKSWAGRMVAAEVNDLHPFFGWPHMFFNLFQQRVRPALNHSNV